MIKITEEEVTIEGKGAQVIAEFIGGFLFILKRPEMRRGIRVGLEALRIAGEKESVFLGELSDLIYKYEDTLKDEE